MARRWRVFHADFPQAAGASLRLSPSESHHIRRVLRLQVGDSLALFDGRGIEWSATITTVLIPPIECPIRVQRSISSASSTATTSLARSSRR